MGKHFSVIGGNRSLVELQLTCTLHCGRRVYWHNPATDGLEVCVVKALDIAKASTHPDGWARYHADALREVVAMRRVAGVPGVAGFRDMVTTPDGAIRLIIEYDPENPSEIWTSCSIVPHVCVAVWSRGFGWGPWLPSLCISRSLNQHTRSKKQA
jgi:hypothetical protein